jgi:hypothetical protein
MTPPVVRREVLDGLTNSLRDDLSSVICNLSSCLITARSERYRLLRLLTQTDLLLLLVGP